MGLNTRNEVICFINCAWKEIATQCTLVLSRSKEAHINVCVFVWRYTAWRVDLVIENTTLFVGLHSRMMRFGLSVQDK